MRRRKILKWGWAILGGTGLWSGPDPSNRVDESLEKETMGDGQLRWFEATRH